MELREQPQPFEHRRPGALARDHGRQLLARALEHPDGGAQLALFPVRRGSLREGGQGLLEPGRVGCPRLHRRLETPCAPAPRTDWRWAKRGSLAGACPTQMTTPGGGATGARPAVNATSKEMPVMILSLQGLRYTRRRDGVKRPPSHSDVRVRVRRQGQHQRQGVGLTRSVFKQRTVASSGPVPAFPAVSQRSSVARRGASGTG